MLPNQLFFKKYSKNVQNRFSISVKNIFKLSTNCILLFCYLAEQTEIDNAKQIGQKLGFSIIEKSMYIYKYFLYI